MRPGEWHCVIVILNVVSRMVFINLSRFNSCRATEYKNSTFYRHMLDRGCDAGQRKSFTAASNDNLEYRQLENLAAHV